MSATSAVLRAEITIPGRPGVEFTAAPSAIPSTANPLAFFGWFASLISGLVSGLGARVRLAVEDSTPTAATASVVMDQANATAGDWIAINGVKYTVVAGAATAASGQFSKDTSATAMGDSFVLALAAYPPNAPVATGSNAAGTVTLTAVEKGTQANSYLITESDAAGGFDSIVQFSGGRDAGSLQTVNLTFSGLPIANETITIGGKTLTFKAASGNQNEITIGADAAATAVNTTTIINANTDLKGLVLASSGGSGITAVQLLQTGRIGLLIALSEAATNTAWSAASFAPTQTSTWVASPAVFAVGASTTAQ